MAKVKIVFILIIMEIGGIIKQNYQMNKLDKKLKLVSDNIFNASNFIVYLKFKLF